jgi:dihydropteroate synthase
LPELLAIIAMRQTIFSKKPLIMGVINITPDSFSDGGEFFSIDAALQQAKKLIEEGADILDIGGESTRPGSVSIDVNEEMRRVSSLLEVLVKDNIPVSIDTSKPEIMQYAITAGAAMINDVNALRAPGALETVAASDSVAVCMMHMQGKPSNMQNNPEYVNIIDEVMAFLDDRIQAAMAHGIMRDRIIIDPGFGFGKTLQHNLLLLRDLGQFSQLGVPVLAGISRKSMLGMITGNPVDQRVHESVAAAMLAVINGASIVRVHDVKATRDALAVYHAMQDADVG